VSRRAVGAVGDGVSALVQVEQEGLSRAVGVQDPIVVERRPMGVVQVDEYRRVRVDGDGKGGGPRVQKLRRTVSRPKLEDAVVEGVVDRGREVPLVGVEVKVGRVGVEEDLLVSLLDPVPVLVDGFRGAREDECGK